MPQNSWRIPMPSSFPSKIANNTVEDFWVFVLLLLFQSESGMKSRWHRNSSRIIKNSDRNSVGIPIRKVDDFSCIYLRWSTFKLGQIDSAIEHCWFFFHSYLYFFMFINFCLWKNRWFFSLLLLLIQGQRKLCKFGWDKLFFRI